MEPLSTASDEPAEADPPAEPARWSPPAWAIAAAVVLAVWTVVRLGLSVNSVLWAAVQVVLVGVASYDFVNRRVKNAVTVPVSVAALLLRLGFERSVFVEVLLAGLIAFLAFFALAIFLKGGLGMGDVKLAGMLGFLLGEDVLRALLIGAIAGGVGALFVLSRSTGKRTTLAYGPYLALGGAISILFFSPPPLV
jgi:leader peptidase (prepilin peptidase)/N-methyltransferase